MEKRPIKFRFYDKALNKMIYRPLFRYDLDHPEIEVMQFTGLHDKNGKEIYEEDIVEIIHPCWNATCKTEFMDGAFWFIEKDNPVNNSQVRADKFLKEKWEIKVIGNIYENK